MKSKPSEPGPAPAEWLVLVPTKFEQQIIKQHDSVNGPLSSEIIGFGPIVSAARTAQLLQQFRPQRVLLLGLAGTFTDDLQVGSAACFSSVGCYGVGVGAGHSFRSASELGWQQWPGDGVRLPLSDRIELRESTVVGARFQECSDVRRLLLTTPAASACEQDASDRLQMFPDAVAEDMEGFSVAAACHLAGVRLTIVRGISNRVGDRDKSNWKIKPALAAAVELSRERGYLI
jgi:futalosine hydrolase